MEIRSKEHLERKNDKSQSLPKGFRLKQVPPIFGGSAPMYKLEKKQMFLIVFSYLSLISIGSSVAMIKLANEFGEISDKYIYE